MLELQNIKFKEYLTLDNTYEYDYCAKFAYKFKERIDHFGIGDLMQKPFGDIKDFQYDLEHSLSWQQMTNYFTLFSGVSSKEIGDKLFIEICQAKSFLVSEMEQLIEIERIALASQLESDEEEADTGELRDFGIYLQLRKLAVTFNTTIYEIKKWPYEDCFTELVADKRIYEYNKRLSEIRRRHLRGR